MSVDPFGVMYMAWAVEGRIVTNILLSLKVLNPPNSAMSESKSSSMEKKIPSEEKKEDNIAAGDDANVDDADVLEAPDVEAAATEIINSWNPTYVVSGTPILLGGPARPRIPHDYEVYDPYTKDAAYYRNKAVKRAVRRRLQKMKFEHPSKKPILNQKSKREKKGAKIEFLAFDNSSDSE